MNVLRVSHIGLVKSFLSSLVILVVGAVGFSMAHPHSLLWILWLGIAFVLVWLT